MQNMTFKVTDKVQFSLCTCKKKDLEEEGLQWIRLSILKCCYHIMAYWISFKASSLPHFLMEYVCMCMDLAYVQHIFVKPSRKIMVSYYRKGRNLTFQDLTFLDCQNLLVSSLTFPYLFCLYFIKKIQFQKIFCWFYLEEILKMFITLKSHLSFKSEVKFYLLPKSLSDLQ